MAPKSSIIHHPLLGQISKRKHSPNMLILKIPVLRPSQKPRSLDNILNLATVQRHLSHLIKLLISKSISLSRPTQELGPDVSAGL
jgi:hypothetical protein